MYKMKRNYNPELKSFARELRKHSTPGEVRLWCELLRGRRMYGYQFLRQMPFQEYVVDFACRKIKLAIELDGYSHHFRFIKDKRKDEVLKRHGYNVLRFSEKQIMMDLQNVNRAIESYIEEYELKHPPVSQSETSPFREGGPVMDILS